MFSYVEEYFELINSNKLKLIKNRKYYGLKLYHHWKIYLVFREKLSYNKKIIKQIIKFNIGFKVYYYIKILKV